MVAHSDVSSAVDEFMQGLVKRNPGEEEFHQAVHEVTESVMPFVLGYGVVYFALRMLEHTGESIEGKTCAISGSGNVAIYTAEKALELGAKVITLSDSDGTMHDPDGLDADKLDYVRQLKVDRHGRISEYAEKYGCEYLEGEKPWRVPCDLAFPGATQNEIDTEDAQALIDNDCLAVVEGANMPTTREAVRALQEHEVLFGPGKAANAGGVAVSGLEQTQNALRIPWTREQVDDRLQGIMDDIHAQCTHWGAEDDGPVDYVRGANLAGFKRVADAMLAYGIV